MPMASLKTFLAISLVLSAVASWIPAYAQLSPYFYNSVCPQALPTIKFIALRAIMRERRVGASLLRLHFHDCFVNGCDGSILLDDTPTFRGEKTAFPNVNSVRGFDVVDQIKTAVNTVCGANVVSCADILAVAARDSVEILGGPLFHYDVLLGRKDSTNASWNDANNNLPGPFSSFSQLLSNFQSHGLNLKDLVVLSGGHSIGLAKCSSFRNRIYSDNNIAPSFVSSLKNVCPRNGGDDNNAPLDPTPAGFDNLYYNELLNRRGLLHSDQELFKGMGSESDKLVVQYSRDPFAFARDFGASMINMGNMKPLTGKGVGQIRANCRKVN